MRTGRPLRLLAVLAACALCLGMGTAAVASPQASSPTAARAKARTWHVLVGGQGHHHAIQTMGFYPKHLWIDQGDTVEWDADAAEIHTVTFFAKASPCPDGSLCAMPQGGFSPADQIQSTAHGSHTYDGTSFYNSGVVTRGKNIALPPFVKLHRHYRLTFPEDLAPGVYAYYCLVHGIHSKGIIVVQPKGTPYPLSQRQYDRRAHRTIAAQVRDGMQLWKRTQRRARRLNRGGGTTTVFNGVMDQTAMVMRFVPEHVRLHKGQRIRFVASGMGPHTVTFGNPGTGCGKAPCDVEQAWNVKHLASGNLVARYPGRNAGFAGSPHALNSGVMLGRPMGMKVAPPHYPARRLWVTFTRRGKVPYICALHAYMGMVGSVRVTG